MRTAQSPAQLLFSAICHGNYVVYSRHFNLAILKPMRNKHNVNWVLTGSACVGCDYKYDAYHMSFPFSSENAQRCLLSATVGSVRTMQRR